MHIYFAHASSFSFREELYEPLKQSRLWSEHIFILPHETNQKVIASSRDIIASCDMVLAEVSFPSTGLGIELGWAHDLKKEIMCLYREGQKYSSALTVVSKNFFSYRAENMMSTLEQILLR